MNEIRRVTISGEIWSGEFGQLVDDRQDYGEPRINTTGKLRGRMVVITWTPRGGDVRVISMRYRHEREAREWEEAMGRSV